MIDECFEMLAAMARAPGGEEQPPPTQDAPRAATNQQPPHEGSPHAAGETEEGHEHPAPAGHKRQRGDRHKDPCVQLRAREDETRQDMGLLTLHDPPSTPVTGRELATTLTRAALADSLETQLKRRLRKNERNSIAHLQTVAGQVACALYDSNLVVAAVHASRLVKPPPARKRDTAMRPSQMQMLVEWRPTLIDAWARPLVRRAGYTIQSETQVSRAEIHADASHPLRQQVQCELCCGRHGGTNNLWWCNECHRCYHLACLGQPPQDHPAQGWKCPACVAQVQQEGNDPGLLLVEWEREWHPLGRDMDHPAACFDSPEGRAALAEWAVARDAPAAAPNQAADTGLPNLARQQPEDRPGTWKTTRGSAIRNKVKLQVAPINPQADITPPGVHAIVIKHGRHTLACVYGPDGRLVGTLGTDTLANLKQRFDMARDTGRHTSITPPVGPFEREVAELICRSKDKQKFRSATGKACEVQWALCPSVPRLMLDGLIQTLGITKERFASPLDVHHSVTHYNSAHPRDAVFGAAGDAYATPWTGWSWGHPPHCPAALDKAVAWAAASARAAQERNVPSATLLMLPRVGDAPPHIQRLGLNADVSTHLGTIRGGPAATCMHILPWWAGGPAHAMTHLKEDVDLVLVWNAAARSDTGRHAAAVREAVRQHGPPELRALAAAHEGTGEQAEGWLGRLIMDTVRMAVGLASALRFEHDVPGGPSQGAVTYATPCTTTTTSNSAAGRLNHGWVH